MKRALVILALGVLAVGCRSSAPAVVKQAVPPPPSMDVPQIATAPVVDGDLSDWPATAATVSAMQPFIGGDYQAQIDETPTTVRLAWTPAALYIAFACEDADRYLVPREGEAETSLHMGDLVEVFIDPVGDATSWLELQVNPLGQIFDKAFAVEGEAVVTETGRLDEATCRDRLWREDQGYTVQAQTAARMAADGSWTVEIAIPAAALGAADGLTPRRLRANLARYDWRPVAGEDRRSLLGMLWSPVQSGCPHISPHRMGTLRLTAR